MYKLDVHIELDVKNTYPTRNKQCNVSYPWRIACKHAMVIVRKRLFGANSYVNIDMYIYFKYTFFSNLLFIANAHLL